MITISMPFVTMFRCIIYVLVHITPEMIPYLLFVILQIPMALQVVMILTIDLGTDLLPAIALAYEVRPKFKSKTCSMYCDELTTVSPPCSGDGRSHYGEATTERTHWPFSRKTTLDNVCKIPSHHFSSQFLFQGLLLAWWSWDCALLFHFSFHFLRVTAVTPFFSYQYVQAAC